MERREIKVDLEPFGTCGDEEIRIPLQEAIENLTAARDEIPEQFRDTALFRIWGSGDYVSVYPEVTYKRPETDDEYARRQAKDENYRAEQAAREKAQYEYLKSKFEPST